MNTTHERSTVLITGSSGNLGTRLINQLADFDVVGLDFAPPQTSVATRFFQVDLGREASCHEMVSILRSTEAAAVVHLAFVIDPMRTGVLDLDRMWQINVAGTARVMEAISEVNRSGGSVRKFIFPSSVSVYGPELARPATENSPFGAHTLPYAVHKRESDEVVQMRASSLGACHTYILRPHIYAGATMQNYLIGMLRGTPGGKSKRAERWRAAGKRLPLMLPFGEQYVHKLFQFVHVDDVARLITWILCKQDSGRQSLTTLNVAGRGEPLSIAQCAQVADQKIVRMPSRWACSKVLKILWSLGMSSIPPEALPYMIGSYLMDTARLRSFLGGDYERVIRFANEEALRDSFATENSRQEENIHEAVGSA